MAVSDRPRERLQNLGGGALSDAELLSIILRSGGRNNSALVLAQKILKEFGGYRGLAEVSLQQLTGFKDVGEVKAVCVKALGEICLRMTDNTPPQRKIVNAPQIVFDIVRKEVYSQHKERLYLISLDTRNALIAKDLISMGTVNETLVHPREVFRQAIVRNAVSIILVHNHPSQDAAPSKSDILLTEQMAQAGLMIDIPLVDHVVVTDAAFVSMRSLNLFAVKKIESKGGDENA